MNEDRLTFSLTQEEKDFLKELAYISIKNSLENKRETTEFEPPSEKLKEHLGVFVTLKEDGQLRGCLGDVLGDKPVWENVVQISKQAAFNDPRFPPLTRQELENLEIEISLLGPPIECKNIEEIEPGRHGLIIQRGFHSGLLLPQVAIEQGWDKYTFLAQTCIKAGLPANCWKSKKVQIICFEAEVF